MSENEIPKEQIETEKPKESLDTTEKQMTWLKETVIRHLTETYGVVDNIENLITVKSNDFKDGKGEYSISFHAFCNELNKRNEAYHLLKIVDFSRHTCINFETFDEES